MPEQTSSQHSKLRSFVERCDHATGKPYLRDLDGLIEQYQAALDFIEANLGPVARAAVESNPASEPPEWARRVSTDSNEGAYQDRRSE